MFLGCSSNAERNVTLVQYFEWLDLARKILLARATPRRTYPPSTHRRRGSFCSNKFKKPIVPPPHHPPHQSKSSKAQGRLKPVMGLCSKNSGEQSGRVKQRHHPLRKTYWILNAILSLRNGRSYVVKHKISKWVVKMWKKNDGHPILSMIQTHKYFI